MTFGYLYNNDKPYYINPHTLWCQPLCTRIYHATLVTRFNDWFEILLGDRFEGFKAIGWSHPYGVIYVYFDENNASHYNISREPKHKD